MGTCAAMPLGAHSPPRMRTLPPTTATFPEMGTPSLAQRIASALLLFVATSVATRLAFLNARFLNIDEAAHLLGARALVHGDRLYVDFADNKPPLVYAFYALAQWMLGPGLDSVRWFGALVLIPAIALAALAYFRFERAGVAAGLAFVVTSSTLFASDGQVVHCEHVMLLPLAWSLVITRAPGFFSRTRLLLAVGALVGLATLGKQPAALSLVAYGVGVLLFAPGALAKARGLVALALGFVAPWALLLLVFAQQQSATDAVFWIWQYNAGHMDNPMSNVERVERLAWYGAALLPAMLPLLAAWDGDGRSIARRAQTHGCGASSPSPHSSLASSACACSATTSSRGSSRSRSPQGPSSDVSTSTDGTSPSPPSLCSRSSSRRRSASLCTTPEVTSPT